MDYSYKIENKFIESLPHGTIVFGNHLKHVIDKKSATVDTEICILLKQGESFDDFIQKLPEEIKKKFSNYDSECRDLKVKVIHNKNFFFKIVEYNEAQANFCEYKENTLYGVITKDKSSSFIEFVGSTYTNLDEVISYIKNDEYVNSYITGKDFIKFSTIVENCSNYLNSKKTSNCADLSQQSNIQKEITNQTLSFPIENDSILKFLPENTIVFGEVIRDTISGDTFNYVDILCSQDEIPISLANKINVKAYELGYEVIDQEFQAKHNSYSEDNNFLFYGTSCILSKDGKNFGVKFNIVKPKAKDENFISDFDVNSLYGVVAKDKLNVLGSICTELSTEAILCSIQHKEANAVFPQSVLIARKAWRTRRIKSKNYKVIDQNKPVEDFLKVSSIFIDALHFIQNQNKSNQTTSENTKENNMTTSTTSFVDRLKKNAVEGAYQAAARVAIDQFIEGSLLAMRKAGMDEVSIGLASAFAKSEAGTAAISALIGMGVPYIPVEALQNNEVAMKIADKCVENAAADTGQLLSQVALNFVKPALEAAANSFTKATVNPIGIQLEQPKVRVKPVELINDDTSLDDLQALEVALLEKRAKLQNKAK